MDESKRDGCRVNFDCRVGLIVTNLSRAAEWVVAFYNHRGTAEPYIKEGTYAIKWTRSSCGKFRNNEVRLDDEKIGHIGFQQRSGHQTGADE